MFAVVFPSSCSLCGQELAEAAWVGICRNCWASLQHWEGPACSHCGLPFASVHPLESPVSLCTPCRQGEYEFDLARTYGLYAGKLRGAVLQMKFQRRQRLGERLGELLAGVWAGMEEEGEDDRPLLVPVPLHPSRERVRGYNQAGLLARGLSRALGKAAGAKGFKVERDCLRRTRATPPQTGLSLRARHENVRGVFVVALPERVRGRVVALVDDVMTTGATLSACAATLKGAGARRVVALTLARATPQFPDGVAIAASPPVDEPGHVRT